jgi:hypothetical protein
VSAAAVVITIALEAAGPSVVIDALNDGEVARLEDWLARRPELTKLVGLALELDREKRVA